jgi:tRNA (guanine-N7-)-methyltransferase
MPEADGAAGHGAGQPFPVGQTVVFTPRNWTETLRLGELYAHPERPLEIDLGCGKGRFLAARAARYPDRNFLGIDRLLVRVRKADRKAVRGALANVRLLRIESAYAVERLLPPGAVAICYVFFPDPWPKRRHHRRRLFTPAFVASLRRALASGGEVHIRSDNADCVAAIDRCFRETGGFAPIPPYEPAPDEITEFEEIFRAQQLPIARLSYRRT